MTSVKAAARVNAFRASHEAKIFSAIDDCGDRGATFKEIAALTGLDPIAVARRLSAMGKRGLIERQLREIPESGDDWRERGGCAIWWARRAG